MRSDINYKDSSTSTVFIIFITGSQYRLEKVNSTVY